MKRSVSKSVVGARVPKRDRKQHVQMWMEAILERGVPALV